MENVIRRNFSSINILLCCITIVKNVKRKSYCKSNSLFFLFLYSIFYLYFVPVLSYTYLESTEHSSHEYLPVQYPLLAMWILYRLLLCSNLQSYSPAVLVIRGAEHCRLTRQLLQDLRYHPDHGIQSWIQTVSKLHKALPFHYQLLLKQIHWLHLLFVFFFQQ